jgi:hypothetical protein
MVRYKRKFEELYNNIPSLPEAVILPKEYLSNLEKKFKVLQMFKFKKLTQKSFCMKLNFLFLTNRIEFIPQSFIEKDSNEEGVLYGINKAATISNKKATIGVFINPLITNISNNKNFQDQFIKWLILNLKHELIHRGQNLRIKDLKIRSEVMSEKGETQIEYLSRKPEIMARAWEIVELFRLKNYSLDEIRQLLKTVNKEKLQNHTLNVYHSIFTVDNWQLRLLYKYMQEYIEKEV